MKRIITTLALALMINGMQAQHFQENKFSDKNGFSYVSFTNDQAGVRVYTLKNGLKVYLAKNTDAPRVQTYIAVRAGSNDDPVDNTGLAHYLEHMMFKGTSKIGSSDWEKEKVLIAQISDLYEKHKAEKDPEKKKEIYKQIDKISQEASKYAIANEYDKAINSLGASGTNAHTWLDETVYKNNIPSNELEKWFKVESERFSTLVLRLFHTELEAVYEEFNMGQDNDSRQVNRLLMDALFPTHPNGQKTTIGESEHLKNPSMEAIHKYFDQYYVPNNYAIVLVGDIDFDKTILLAEKYFGKFQPRVLPERNNIAEKPMDKVEARTWKSPSAARLQMAWRTDSYGTKEARLADMVAQILSNSGGAGLIDLNINQKQKVLTAGAYTMPFKKYGSIVMYATPKENQSLDEAKNLILGQIDLIKKGQFPDWILSAIINDKKLERMKVLESANGLASSLYESYIRERNWTEELEDIAEYEKITKEDIVKFANDFFKDNYAIVYKEKGENEKLIRVENPGITPIKINRDSVSPFVQSIINEKVEDIKPQFVDYKKEIKEDKLNGIPLSFIQNKTNNLASMNIFVNIGTDNDKELGTAVSLFEYFGTDKYSPEALKEEFFKLGVSYGIQVNKDKVTISLSGLEENLPKGLQLFNHWLKNVKADKDIYKREVNATLEMREVAKKDKRRILSALANYAKFGKNSRFRDVVTKERLLSANPEEFTKKIKELLNYQYEVFFYGKDLNRFKKEAGSVIKAPAKYAVAPAPKNYPEPETTGKVYFTNYDMVQVDLSQIGRGEEVSPSNFGKVDVFNEYFGSGLSSIVFQEIRESRSLAYSAYVNYALPGEIKKHAYINTYVGTQANKLGEAVSAMKGLMENLPQIPVQFQNAKISALKQIASQRITKRGIYYNYLAMKKLGLKEDVRKMVYNEIQGLDLTQLTNYYNQKIKPIRYNTIVMGKKENLDMNTINKLGEFQEVSLEELFGY